MMEKIWTNTKRTGTYISIIVWGYTEIVLTRFLFYHLVSPIEKWALIRIISRTEKTIQWKKGVYVLLLSTFSLSYLFQYLIMFSCSSGSPPFPSFLVANEQ